MSRRIHFWCFVAVIALAPAPLGSNRPLAWSVLALAVGGLCLSWPLVVEARRRAQVPTPGMLAIPLTAFAGAIVWAVAQTVPGVGAPAVLRVAAASVLRQVAAPGFPGSSPVLSPLLSLDAEAGRTGVLRLLTYGGVFWLALQHGRLSRRPHRLVDALSLVALAYAGYGLFEYVSGTETILGMAKWAYIGDLTSTFVNRNSYATFAGLGLLCCVAAVARRLRDRRPGWAALLLHLRRRTALFAVGAGAVLLALLNTGSRAGVAASLLGLGSLLLFLWIERGDLGRHRAMVLLTVWTGMIIGAAAWLLLGSTTFAVTAFDRALVYRLTLSAIARQPLTGTGLGSFPAVFEGLRPPAIVLPWREAHDTYLELLLELGIPATLALLTPVVWATGRCLSAVLRPGGGGVLTALGAASTILVATHALVDFSAQIPAVTVYWLALLGSGVAQTRWRPPVPGLVTGSSGAGSSGTEWLTGCSGEGGRFQSPGKNWKEDEDVAGPPIKAYRPPSNLNGDH